MPVTSILGDLWELKEHVPSVFTLYMKTTPVRSSHLWIEVQFITFKATRASLTAMELYKDGFSEAFKTSASNKLVLQLRWHCRRVSFLQIPSPWFFTARLEMMISEIIDFILVKASVGLSVLMLFRLLFSSVISGGGRSRRNLMSLVLVGLWSRTYTIMW